LKRQSSVIFQRGAPAKRTYLLSRHGAGEELVALVVAANVALRSGLEDALAGVADPHTAVTASSTATRDLNVINSPGWFGPAQRRTDRE
jgi:hypothetical protein